MSDVDTPEEVIAFTCGPDRLWGVLSRPPATAQAPLAVLIVVGGPQYRVGSHRQFVLLARALARAGYPTLRFDYRGMGDSEGERRDFQSAGPDIGAALEALGRACPGIERFVVWGLCDAASAALMFGAADARVVGIVAANPWARSEASLASTRLRHYYAARLVQREFWAKLLRGGLRWGVAWRSLSGSLRAVASRSGGHATAAGEGRFQDAMARGLAAFRGRVLLILSGNDLTAKEFLLCAGGERPWRGLLEDPKLTRHDIPAADHTFSRRLWLDEVEARTVAWLRTLTDKGADQGATLAKH